MTIQRQAEFCLGVLTGIAGLATLVGAMAFLGIPPGFHTHSYGLFTSAQRKREVLSSAKLTDPLRRAEWNGDDWGGTPGGDWMGYVVYVPGDSLPQMTTSESPRKIEGIPCDVVSVRRLERNWYSVVTDMNQFWDVAHPAC